MTVPSVELRNVTINARTGIGADGPAIWVAQIVVGLLNRRGEQNAPAGPPHDIFRAAAVRVVMQDTRSTPITVSGEAQPGYTRRGLSRRLCVPAISRAILANRQVH